MYANVYSAHAILNNGLVDAVVCPCNLSSQFRMSDVAADRDGGIERVSAEISPQDSTSTRAVDSMSAEIVLVGRGINERLP